jgi:hypothetical protein
MSKRTAHVVEKRDQTRRSSQSSQSKPHILADHVWLVLARRAYSEPLSQVGTVEADDRELARVYAQSIYDEFAWIEMVLVPRETMVTVIES